MKTLWVHRNIDAPAETVWELLTNTDHWASWGPTVRDAVLEGDVFEVGATGSVTTALGVTLPFVITACEPGRRWTWKVAGIPATDHSVQALDANRCRAGFGVPWPAAPYLAVCAAALRTIDSLAVAS